LSIYISLYSIFIIDPKQVGQLEFEKSFLNNLIKDRFIKIGDLLICWALDCKMRLSWLYDTVKLLMTEFPKSNIDYWT
jgi:hypothetical protein